MNNYDFAVLNDKEFEVLAADLVGRIAKCRVERFKSGRDGGVDGRFFATSGREVVMQAKHRPASTFNKLIKHLVDEELAKISRLNPSRYILVISNSLSRKEKTQITVALAPYIKSPSDVLGKEDLNDLLAAYPEVERRHYKLWLSSSVALDQLVNKAIHERSREQLEQIKENAHLYVQTQNHRLAVEVLERLGSVIITGTAGIGKTTLADQLTLQYVTHGFSLVKISEEIKEAEAAWERDQPQLFYFDDFLGRNYLEALSGHEGTHIVNFIKRVSRDTTKRFILTSRSTILNQGKILIDLFQTNNLEKNEFEIHFSTFSAIEKAKILYNHIWHSPMQSEFVIELYKDKRYRKIIDHRNYNPRLIRYITDAARLEDCKPQNYWAVVQSLLNNPVRIWENPFVAQLDDFGRCITLLVTLNGRSIAQDDLAECYARLISRSDAQSMSGRRDFMQTLSHLVGSLLSRTILTGYPPRINLFNPSVGDFVLQRYATDLPSLKAAFCSLRSTSSLNTLGDLEKNALISRSAEASIMDAILDTAHSSNFLDYSVEYIARAAIQSRRTRGSLLSDTKLNSVIRFIVEGQCPADSYYATSMIDLGVTRGIVAFKEAADHVVEVCKRSTSSEEIKVLSALVTTHLKETDPALWRDLERTTAEYLLDSVDEEFQDDDIFDDLCEGEIGAAERALAYLIENKLDELGIPHSESLTDALIEAYDLPRKMEDYFNAVPYDEVPESLSYSTGGTDEIDDLFQRT